jgi:hypothetical protein
MAHHRFRIRNAEDNDLRHSRMAPDDPLHFLRVQVVAAMLDQVLEPAVEVEDAGLVVVTEVTRPREAVLSPVKFRIMAYVPKFWTMYEGLHLGN